MARIFLNSSIKNVDPKQLKPELEAIFQQLEDQINGGTDVIAISDGDLKLPEGIRRNDIVFRLERGEIQVGIHNGADIVYASFGSFSGAITDAQHGPRAGGTLHPNATTAVSGFMSAADKTVFSRYKGDTSSAAPASTTEYPADGDWGYHTDTAGGTYSLAKNKGGTIFTTLLT